MAWPLPWALPFVLPPIAAVVIAGLTGLHASRRRCRGAMRPASVIGAAAAMPQPRCSAGRWRRSAARSRACRSAHSRLPRSRHSSCRPRFWRPAGSSCSAAMPTSLACAGPRHRHECADGAALRLGTLAPALRRLGRRARPALRRASALRASTRFRSSTCPSLREPLGLALRHGGHRVARRSHRDHAVRHRRIS